ATETLVAAGRTQYMVLRRPFRRRVPRRRPAGRARGSGTARRRAQAVDGRRRIRPHPPRPDTDAAGGAGRVNAIDEAHVAHNRAGKHRLRYSVFMLALALDTLHQLDLRRLKHNRLALLSIRDPDHGARVDTSLKPQIQAKLHEAGIAWD